jgi:3-oxoacyl-[acyl-carrier protein] reductase
VELEGRVALVTGGATGLGAAVAVALGRAGAAVAVNYARSADEAAGVVRTIEAEDGRGLAIGFDVRDADALAGSVAEIERMLGPVDVLVNNAGITRFAPFEDLAAVGPEEWERILAVNVIGAWNATRAVANGMRERGAGAVVNVASESVFTMQGSSIPYVVSKAAVVSLTHTLARALAPDVRVNAVAPGWMATPWLDKYLPEEARAALAETPEELVPVEDVVAEILRLIVDEEATDEVTVMAPGLDREPPAGVGDPVISPPRHGPATLGP